LQRNIYVKIEVDKEKQILKITDYHNDKKLFTANIPFKIKKGFLYLDNENVKRKGVPFIYYSVQKSKTRIGLSTKNNLIIQRHNESSGIIFMMSAGSKSDYAYDFKRLVDI